MHTVYCYLLCNNIEYREREGDVCCGGGALIYVKCNFFLLLHLYFSL